MSSNGHTGQAASAAPESAHADEAPTDALAEVPPGRQGGRASAPVHRADGGHRAGVRLLGHALEPLRQMDAARRRAARGGLRHRVSTARCTPRSCRTSRAVARSAACPWPSGRRARRRRCPRASRPASQLAPFRVEQAGIKTAEVGLRPADRDPDDRRLRRVRRAADGQHRLEGPRQVAGREALRQLHRPGRRGRPAAGRALQPRAVPGDPGAAQRSPPRGAGRRGRRPTLARSLLGDPQRAGPRCRPRSSSGGGSPRPRSTRSSRRARPTSRSRSSRRSAATCSRRTSSRARRCQEGYPMFEVVDLRHGLGPGPGLRAPTGPGPRRAGGRGDGRGVSRARRFRARSSSSSRTSTRRPARSKSGTPWRTPAIGSGPGCSPR